jgi:hypothetical protein
MIRKWRCSLAFYGVFVSFVTFFLLFVSKIRQLSDKFIYILFLIFFVYLSFCDQSSVISERIFNTTTITKNNRDGASCSTRTQSNQFLTTRNKHFINSLLYIQVFLLVTLTKKKMMKKINKKTHKSKQCLWPELIFLKLNVEGREIKNKILFFFQIRANIYFISHLHKTRIINRWDRD